jgi:hypothetical protein
MAELTNLTDRLAHLRDRKSAAPMLSGDAPDSQIPKKTPKKSRKKLVGRRFANDYFMVFVYVLLGVAVLTQFVLIAWLDVV